MPAFYFWVPKEPVCDCRSLVGSICAQSTMQQGKRATGESSTNPRSRFVAVVGHLAAHFPLEVSTLPDRLTGIQHAYQ
jgi:hypothetical protein